MHTDAEQGFMLKTRDEVLRFEFLAEAYAKKRILIPLRHFSLVSAYDYSQKREDGAKLFSAIFDIYINYLMLWSDQVSAGKAWDEGINSVNPEEGSILDSELKFFRKMEMHKFNTSFIFRYRALWDKLMGFSVLFFAPKEYECFIKAKSRKKSFKKIFSDKKVLPIEFITLLETTLENFDSKLRTPEAHGTGSIRKRSFASQPLESSPMAELSTYWNFIINYMIAIGKLFPFEEKGTDAVIDV